MFTDFVKDSGHVNGTIVSPPANLFDRYAAVRESKIASVSDKTRFIFFSIRFMNEHRFSLKRNILTLGPKS